jgi:hypothetical protein
MLPPVITLTFTKLKWDEFTAMLLRCEKIINYVRHKPTVDLLSSIGVSFESGFEYKLLDADDTIIFMIGLKSRAPTSGADITVTADDLLIYLVKPVQT